ncbi:hypothetical protein [Haloferula sp. BvORR071]|uniref:hypothetical protein n=1 Tax=Haloferula sp. BvORR071 TaxID=1396141 RepID=UPI00054CEE64|nr:hypothetical protein [Haloferula sp. BvORR071]
MAEICYACLKAPGVTRDHVPPKCFYPLPVPVDLITVACCHECNGGNAPPDDYVRTVLASLLARSAAGERIWEEKVVPGFLPRNPRTVDAILATMEDKEMVLDGVLQEVVSFDAGWERMTEYFTRLTKGLLRHHYASYDYSASVFRVQFLHPWDERLGQLEAVRDMLNYDRIGEGVFQYRHSLSDTGQSGLWMLVFYEAILVLVHHTNSPPQA